MTLKTLNVDPRPVEPTELKGDPHHLAPLLRDVLAFTKAEKVLDATAGSGVTAKVCDEKAIRCDVSDLNDPARGTDLFTLTSEELGTYDLVVYHPDLWRSRPDAVHPHDLGGTMDWADHVDLNVEAIEHLVTLLNDNGHIVVVCPITRRRGKVYDLSRDLTCIIGAPKEPPVIHPHAECRSRGTLYGQRFIPIAHDNVLLWTKTEVQAGMELPLDEE